VRNSLKKRTSRKSRRVNKHYSVCKSVSDDSPVQIGPKKDDNPKRAPYFRINRSERWALKALENVSSKTFNYKEKRAIRYLYYKIIPCLAKHLWWSPDRERLLDTERTMYNIMLSHYYHCGQRTVPYRVELWRFRYNPTMEHGGTGEALMSPQELLDQSSCYGTAC